jgi:hypothetical protein
MPLLVLMFLFLLSKGMPVSKALSVVTQIAVWMVAGIFVVVAFLVGIQLAGRSPLARGPRGAVIRRCSALVSEKLPPLLRLGSTGFSWELLQALEWRSFEKLVAGYFRAIGLEAERVRAGADGGVDLVVRKPGVEAPFAYVQCKAWHAYLVGVKPVRELFGVMAADGVAKGYLVCTGAFTPEATAFAQGKPLKLVTGAEFLEKLTALDAGTREALFEEITAGDYTTPTCPSCDEKMVRREGKDGASFWGCRNFPKCWRNFPIPKGRIS